MTDCLPGKEANKDTNNESYKIKEEIKKRIKSKYDEENSLLTISARGDLENFFPCPRKWMLKRILKLHDDTLETNLMQSFDMGNLNHKIRELFMKEVIDNKLPIYKNDDNNFYETTDAGQDNCTDTILNLIRQKTDEGIKAPSDFRDSLLAIQTLESQKEKIRV